MIHLRDRIVTLWNPCPEHTVSELAERKNILNVRDASPAFAVQVNWSSGEEAESVTMAPGQRIELPEPVAREVEKQYRHRGIVVVERFDSHRDAAIAGLSNAIDFFRARGTESIFNVQSARSWTDEHVSKLRNSDLKSQFLNQAREEVLVELLEEWQTRPDESRETNKALGTAAVA